MKTKFNVAIMTGTRAEYGLLRPVIREVLNNKQLSLKLLVTGSHLVRSLGYTISEINADRTPIDFVSDILGDDERCDKSLAMAEALSSFSKYFRNHSIDALVILGDRYEAFAVAAAAVSCNVPIAHISGGDVTEGAADDFYRHCITKMSCLHFPSTEVYRKRVIQLGESPDRVFNVGSLGAENIKNMPKLSAAEVSQSIGFDCTKPFLLATFHPETLSGVEVTYPLNQLLDAVSECKIPVLFTKANADEGGVLINQTIERYCERNPTCQLVSSLGVLRYLSAMAACSAVIGNSSSAIVEAPTLKKPAINIGDRQKGRIVGINNINCVAKKQDIVDAINKAVSDDFKKSLKNMKSPYDISRNASEAITEKLVEFLKEDKMQVKKAFYDVDFTV